MKNIYTFVIFIIIGLFLLLTITQCTKDNDNQEKKCITSFLETYFTNEIPLATDAIPDLKIYKKYLTNDAYESFYIDRIYPYELKGNIDNLEICDIEIESIPNKNDTYHNYNVSFTLKNNENNKEKEVTNFEIRLEKEGIKWKISNNNNLYFLQKWLVETL
jgi:hypothetical protein